MPKESTPYLQISREFAENMSIRSTCTAMILYILTEIYPAEFSSADLKRFRFQRKVGRDSIPKLIKEAESAGYICKQYRSEKGLRRLKYKLNEELLIPK